MKNLSKIADDYQSKLDGLEKNAGPKLDLLIQDLNHNVVKLNKAYKDANGQFNTRVMERFIKVYDDLNQYRQLIDSFRGHLLRQIPEKV